MNERRDIESTIIASLLKKPELIEKLRVRPYMFYYDDFRVFMEYVFEVGKVDHQEIFLETSKNKNFLDFDTIQNSTIQILSAMAYSNVTNRIY